MTPLNSDLPPNTCRAAKLRAVVLDWAGTVVDYGSLAPVRTLQRVFEEAGLELREEEARRDMGLPKRDHIQAILNRKLDAGQDVNQHDVDALYARFIPLQLECLEQYSELIPGVCQAVARMRQQGLQIATTTGYTRSMLDLLIAKASGEGFQADANLSPEDVGSGRPNPFMIFHHAIRLKVFPLSAIVKVGDTVADIQEGLNAGTWSVGVTKTGNTVGISREAFDCLSPERQNDALQNARAALAGAGAHFVVDSVADLDPVLRTIGEILSSRSHSKY